MAREVKISSRKSRMSIARANRSRKSKRSGFGSSRFQDERNRKIAKVFLIVVAVILVGMLGGSVYAFSWLQKFNDTLPTMEEVFPNPPASSIIYDRTGKQLYRVIGDYNSDPVRLENIPDLVRWPFLAAEDVDFYHHDGFDTSGILRCGFNYLKAAGSSLCGGSTITQQLIKITALSNETSRVERKIKELFMSTKVEQANTKDEILQMYLSVTPYGGNIVGIETAADYYFGKEPKDLSLAEASILASIIQNPSYLSPTNPVDGDIEAARARVKERQLYVLGQIEEHISDINSQILSNAQRRASENGEDFDASTIDLFTREMIEEARNAELVFNPPIATDKLAGHFVDFVLAELQRKEYRDEGEAFTLSELQTGGYKITTTLDYELQRIAERHAEAAGNQYYYWNIHNAAVMTMLPKSGQIITMAGSKGFVGESEGCDENGANCLYNPEVNILATLQSPGSTNKSLAYYLGYDLGITYPGDLLPDIPISFGGYDPKNWDSGYRGVENTVREMLRQSRNLPALVMIEAVGVGRYIETAREFGYTTYEDASQFGHSVVLGGTTVYPYEHAAAYGVFANQGDYVAPESILKIEDSNGRVIYEAKPEPKQVASPQGTFLLNQTLYNLEGISWDGRDIAAKTGTSESNIDSLMIMYSPDFVTLGWVGNNNNQPTDPFNGFASIVVKPWLLQYMQEIGGASYFTERTPFVRPGFVFRGGGSCNDNGQCIGLEADWMIEGKSYTPYIEMTEAVVCKDQPDKLAREIDIAIGMSETRQFKRYKLLAPSWQGFLDNFIRDRGIATAVPTEECTVDRGDLTEGPLIRFNSASAPTAQVLDLNVDVYTTEESIVQVDIYLNGILIDQATEGFPSILKSIDISSLGLTEGQRYNLDITARDNTGLTNTFSDRILVGPQDSAGTGSNPPSNP